MIEDGSDGVVEKQVVRLAAKESGHERRGLPQPFIEDAGNLQSYSILGQTWIIPIGLP